MTANRVRRKRSEATLVDALEMAHNLAEDQAARMALEGCH